MLQQSLQPGQARLCHYRRAFEDVLDRVAWVGNELVRQLLGCLQVSGPMNDQSLHLNVTGLLRAAE